MGGSEVECCDFYVDGELVVYLYSDWLGGCGNNLGGYDDLGVVKG